MFIANDSNYSFGQFLAVVDGDDIKAPVYSKCFTDTEALKGYRFIHDPEETDPEKCVCFSIYSETASEATSTAFGKGAVVSDLTSVMFRLDTDVPESHLRNVPYYHVIVPVVNIKDETELKYLVIKMTKEVELFPENYPYYELVSTFADAEPTSAEAPGGVTPTGTITITENDTYDVTNYASAEVNVSGGSSDFSTATVTIVGGSSTIQDPYAYELPAISRDGLSSTIVPPIAGDEPNNVDVILYKGKSTSTVTGISTASELIVSGNATYDTVGQILTITGNCTLYGYEYQ